MSTERSREAEIVVPGRPDEVWDAIATSEGHAAWIFPADIDDSSVTIHREPFGPDVTANVTARERPRRFTYEEPIAPELPPLATELLVEARDDGTCVVRVVTGFAEAGDEWEDLLDGVIEGWRMSLLILRAYLTHFRGRANTYLSATVDTRRPVADRAAIAERLLERLGVAGLAAGATFRTKDDAPPLTGVVEYASEAYVLLRTDAALFAVSAFPMADPTVSLNVTGYLYGSGSGKREEKHWRDWLTTI